MKIPDNLDMFEKYDAEKEHQLKKLPKCTFCKEPIQQEDAVFIHNEFICDICLEELRKDIEQ